MKNNMIKTLIILIAVYTGCKEEPPVVPLPPEPKAVLTIQDVCCIEAWIKLELENIDLPVNVSLFKDSIPVLQINNLTGNDTIIYTDSLQPNQAYKFQSVIQPTNQSMEVKSNELLVTTLTPTSQSYTWQAYSWGMHSSSEIKDIAIIDESNIWCVGEIYMNDSLGNPEPSCYNAVHWDGNNWELKRIYTYSSCNPVDYAPLKAIWAFSENNIAVTSGGSIGWFDGNTNRADCGIRSILTGSINKLWGSSSNDLYAVGNNGNIAHYNGQSWSKIESGTDLNINDIWGISDGNGGFNKYLAAYNAMLKLDANKNLSRIEAESGMHIFSIWGYTNQLIYVVGGENDALYKNYKWEIINDPLVNTLYRIKGQNYNDVFGISSLGTILHFNGYNWGSINVPVENIFLKLDVKGNVISTVGWQGKKAVITIIRRNN
jgi:hypothetical protein